MKMVSIIAGMVLFANAFTAPAQTLTVNVSDQNGQPVSGAVISFTPISQSPIAPNADSEVVVRQKDLQFQPFTTLAPVGSKVTFKNEDDVLHHVFSFSKTKRFNLTLFGRDEPQSVIFENAGIVTVGCNIHDGMIAHIFIADAPFAAQSDEDGTVSIEDVPAGPGQLVVWHPLMRERKNRLFQEITITADMAQVDISTKLRKGIRRSSDY